MNTPNTSHYDHLVIGAGLIGSAAARYLSQASNSVAVLGPAEPETLETHEGVFASHYDQGRLTRLIGKDLIWATLAKHAIASYHQIEAQSGISFHSPVGIVVIAQPDEAGAYYPQNPLQTATAIQADYTFYPAGDRRWQELFPYLDFPAEFPVLHEPAPAGYINPRALVQAQLTCAQQNGATLIRDTAVSVTTSTECVTIQTANGRTLTADKLLVASGAFTNFNRLLPEPLPLRLKTETIILGEVSAETAAQLADMPTVIHQIEDPEIDDIYMAPPILYPDGRYYIKMGCNTIADQQPETMAQIREWFHHGDSDACKPAMIRALQAQLPHTPFLSFTTRRCIITYTPKGYPLIDQIGERLFVAAGGNGSGAKGSDTIGRLAAGLLCGLPWLADVERRPFQL